MPVKLCFSTSKRPHSTVSWYMKMTFSTIQPMGNRPYPAPNTAVAPAMRAGMWKPKMAMTKAAARPSSAA